MIDFIGLDAVEQFDKTRRVSSITIVQKELNVVNVGVLIEVVNTLGVERWSTADNAVYLVALGEKQFRQIGAILSRNTSYKGFFHCVLREARPSKREGIGKCWVVLPMSKI